MSFKGHIFEIPIGAGGLVGVKNQTDIRPDQLIVAHNITLESTTLRKEGGATKYNSTVISGAPTVLGGWDWWPDASTQRMVVVLSDGTIKKDSGPGTFATTLASALTMTNVVPVFVEGGKEAAANARKLFIFTGANQAKFLSGDGATVADVTTPPADWATSFPTFGFNHNGRMWGAGNSNDPHRLYYSTTTNHVDFTGAGSGTLSIWPGEGERLVGAVSFRGLIIAWKFPSGIYIIDTTDPTVTNWKVKRLTGSVGGVSAHGAVVVDDDIVFVDSSANFHKLSAVTEFSDVSSSNISKLGDVQTFIQDTFNLARLLFIRGVYYGAKREAHFAFASSDNVVNDSRFVVDFNRADVVRFRYSNQTVTESLWLRKDSNTILRLVAGDNAGFVRSLDQAVRSVDGLGFLGEAQTPYMDFRWVDPRFAVQRKIGQFIEMTVEQKGNFNVLVRVFWDGVQTQLIYFNMGEIQAGLGSFVIGTDVLAGQNPLNRKHRLLGSGRRLSLAISNNGAAEDFSIGRIFVHCIVGDERLERE